MKLKKLLKAVSVTMAAVVAISGVLVLSPMEVQAATAKVKVSQSSVTLNWKGDTQKITVNTDKNIKVSYSNMLMNVPKSVKKGKTTISIKTIPNVSSSKKSYTIKFLDGSKVVKTVKISQSYKKFAKTIKKESKKTYALIDSDGGLTQCNVKIIHTEYYNYNKTTKKNDFEYRTIYYTVSSGGNNGGGLSITKPNYLNIKKSAKGKQYKWISMKNNPYGLAPGGLDAWGTYYDTTKVSLPTNTAYVGVTGVSVMVPHEGTTARTLASNLAYKTK